jgi:hypothetical protein
MATENSELTLSNLVFSDLQSFSFLLRSLKSFEAPLDSGRNRDHNPITSEGVGKWGNERNARQGSVVKTLA